jgi:hypothetical protein
MGVQQLPSNPNMIPSVSGKNVNHATTAPDAIRATASISSVDRSARLGAHHELARQAVGRGIRHSIGASVSNASIVAPMPILHTSTSTANSLSELACNYQNSLKEDIVTEESDDDPTPLSRMQGRISSTFDTAFEPNYEAFLSSNSSLIDLAMLAPVDEPLQDPSSGGVYADPSGESYEFMDFPNSY